MARKELSDRKTLGCVKGKTRKITTINDLLTRDDVQEVLNKTIKDKAEITDLICIYQDKEGFINWHITSNTPPDRKVYLLEQVKVWMLEGDNDD